MMLRFALFLMIVFVADAAQAQNLRNNPFVANTYNTTDEPRYVRMVMQALQERPADFRFQNFRSFYTRTQAYDPAGDDARDTLMRLAYIVENEADAEKSAKALADFKATSLQHLGNVNVAIQALSFARQDQKFGDPAMFEWVIDGIIKSVQQSGDGRSQASAYDILTMGEEGLLLDSLGFRSLEAETVETGMTLRMHQVEDRKTGNQYTVFINATRPISYQAYLARTRTNRIDLLNP
jgi:hypothetical protein